LSRNDISLTIRACQYQSMCEGSGEDGGLLSYLGSDHSHCWRCLIWGRRGRKYHTGRCQETLTTWEHS